MKSGGIYTRNYAKDGYSTGANESKGAYAFSGFATGNSFADFLLGLPNVVARAAQHARRPADGHLLERLGAVRSRTTGRSTPA